jgi:hypothetical protein
MVGQLVTNKIGRIKRPSLLLQLIADDDDFNLSEVLQTIIAV